MFTIHTDRDRMLIRASLSGFMTPDDVRDFIHAEQMAAASLSPRSGHHLLLVDASQCALQSQEVVAAFQHAVSNCLLKARRIAVFTGPTLSRMQAARILNRDDAKAFNDPAQAEEWLLAPDEDEGRLRAPRSGQGR
jgi:hypothetical protein